MSRGQGARLLLGDAVDRAEPGHEMRAGDADHSTVGKKISQDPKGHAIIRVVVSRNQNDAVGDIKISVARGQSSVLVSHRAGHGERHDRELFASLIPRALEPLVIFP